MIFFICIFSNNSFTIKKYAQLAEAVKYTYCISAEEQDSNPNECPVYDTKQFDGEAPVILGL